MAGKKEALGLKPMGAPQESPKAAKKKSGEGDVVALTVRMSPAYASKLKITAYERGMTQNTFMLDLIRRELGLV